MAWPRESDAYTVYILVDLMGDNPDFPLIYNNPLAGLFLADLRREPCRLLYLDTFYLLGFGGLSARSSSTGPNLALFSIGAKRIRIAIPGIMKYVLGIFAGLVPTVELVVVTLPLAEVTR